MLLQLVKTESPRGFRLVGEMDLSNVSVLVEALEPEVVLGGDLTLDLAGLAFMDSSGIQAIIRTARGLEGKGHLTLVAPGDLARKTLERVRLGRLANVEITNEAKPETP
jgi:anti-anti-sigma factor